MKRGFVIAAGGAAIVVAGLAGCSSTESSTDASEAVKVTIGGEEQEIKGAVACTTAAGTVNIAIGEATTGIGAVLSEADPPEVKSVGLGNVNGVTLGYAAGAPGGEATATKDDKTYTITGKATGVDTANPLTPITKDFEIEVSCP